MRRIQEVNSNEHYVAKNDDRITTTDEETAELFNNFFQSIFVQEDNYEFQSKCLVNCELSNIEITEQLVKKKLR